MLFHRGIVVCQTKHNAVEFSANNRRQEGNYVFTWNHKEPVGLTPDGGADHG